MKKVGRPRILGRLKHPEAFGVRPARLRGQSLVEFALVAPVFFLMIFGVIQYGIFAAQRAAFTFAVRNADRVASIHANEPTADDQVCAALLQSLKSSAGNPANLTKIIIFKADDGDPNLLNPPTDNTALHDAGTCTGAGGGFAYTGSAPSHPACPPPAGSSSYCTWLSTVRKVSDPPDPIGVTATYNFKFAIPLFGKGITLSDTSILRIEPQCANGSTC